jgi:tRNA(Ile2) C34 agmatinyltransferase TiaS
MNNVQQSERFRKKMEAISERINTELDHSCPQYHSVGIKYENNPEDRCPRCGSGLKSKAGFVKGRQRWKCLICGSHFIEDDE